MKKILLSAAATLLFSAHAHAADTAFTLTLKDHAFTPAELTVPAHTEITITLDNQDKTPEEFESHDLKREKIVGGGTKKIVYKGTLEPGTYAYFGEFNPKTAQGKIIAK